MPELRGTVVITQEGRLHGIDDGGAGRLFILSAQAAGQLAPLQARQARVRVNYSLSPNVIGLAAHRIELADQATRVSGVASGLQVVGHS